MKRQRDDQAGLLGQRHEHLGRHARAGMSGPAGERLDPDDPPVAQRYLRLEMRHDDRRLERARPVRRHSADDSSGSAVSVWRGGASRSSARNAQGDAGFCNMPATRRPMPTASRRLAVMTRSSRRERKITIGSLSASRKARSRLMPSVSPSERSRTTAS